SQVDFTRGGGGSDSGTIGVIDRHLKTQPVWTQHPASPNDGCFRKAIKRLVHLGHSCGLRLGNSACGAAADALPNDLIVVHFASISRSRARRSRSRLTPPRWPTSLLSSMRIRATMRWKRV